MVGGERILDRLVRVMTAALGVPPLLVANSADAPSWRPDLRVVKDPRPGAGPLGGIYAAVLEAPAPVVCVAWDMPFVSQSLIAELASKLEGYDAMVPESGGPRGVEPLCAGYGPGCRSAISISLEDGDLRAVGFHQRITIGILPLADVRRFGDPELLFFNVNTADDLARAEDQWRRLGSSP
jgi:molybdopterin-guanine dinucleotide biosynthesis protein A